MNKTLINRNLSCIIAKTTVWLLFLIMAGTGCFETTKEIPIRLTVSTNALHFPFSGEEQSLTIDSNTNKWELNCDASWITITPSSGVDKATVTVRATSNNETEIKHATITITGTGIRTPVTVAVSIGAAPLLTVSPDVLSFAATDTPKQLIVVSNTSWTVGNTTAWIEVTPVSGINDGTLSVVANANTSTEQRTGSFSVTSPGLATRTVHVTQAGIVPTLQVSTNALSFTAADVPKTINVSSNISWTIIYSFSATWLTVEPMSGTNNETVTVTPAANTNPTGRNADLIVNGVSVPAQIVSVYQSGTASALDMEMVQVPGGAFTMGCTSGQGGDCFSNERPSHSVILSTFYIGKYEVTQEQWRAVMGTNPSSFPKGENYPVESVSWNDVQAFITKLNTMTGKRYRLPTESEWEYVARGGNNGEFEYSGSNTVGNVAWYWDNIPSKASGNAGYGTQPVGTKTPNELGIYDMSGNVNEWCSDWYGSYDNNEQTNPKGPVTGSTRVYRGGSWYGTATSARVSYRYYYPPGGRNDALGFRLASDSN